MVTRSKNAISFYRVSGQSVLLPPVQVRPSPPLRARARAGVEPLCGMLLSPPGDSLCRPISVGVAAGFPITVHSLGVR